MKSENVMPDKVYPSSDLSDRDLKYSRFIMAYRPFLVKALYVLLITFDVIFVTIGAVGFVYHAIDIKNTNLILYQLSTQGIDWNTVRPLVVKPGISVDVVDALSDTRTTDFVARISNPNKNRYAHSLEYRFLWNEGETNWRKSFILPADTKHLVALGVDTVGKDGVSLEIRNIQWRRIDNKDLTDVQELIDGVVITGGTIEQLDTLGAGLPLSAVSFRVTNETPFTYLTTGFVVIVSSGSMYSAIKYESLFTLEAFESRDVDARFFQRLSPGGTVIIEPDINFFDEENIIL